MDLFTIDESLSCTSISSDNAAALISCHRTQSLDVLLTLIRCIAARMAQADAGVEGIANEMLEDDIAFFCASIGLPGKGTKSLQDAVSNVFRIMDSYSCPTDLGAEQVVSKYHPWDGKDVSLELLLEEIDGECKIGSDGENSEGSNSGSGSGSQRRSPNNASPPRQRNTIKNRLDEKTLDALDQLLSEIPDKAADTLEESKSNTTPPISNRSKLSASSRVDLRRRSSLVGKEKSSIPLLNTKQRAQSCKNPSNRVFGFRQLANEMKKTEYMKSIQESTDEQLESQPTLSRGRTATVRFKDAPPSRTCVAKPRNRSISVESFGSSWEYLGDNHLDGGSGSSRDESGKSSVADPILTPGGEEEEITGKHKKFWRLQLARKILKQSTKQNNTSRRQFGKHKAVNAQVKQDNFTVEDNGSVQVNLAALEEVSC